MRRGTALVGAVTLVVAGLGVATPAAAATLELTEEYANNLTVLEAGGGTVTWKDAGANGVVELDTPDNDGQAVVYLPVAPGGLTYGTLSDISSIAYTVPAVTNQTAVINVEVGDSLIGPFRTVQHQPAPGTTGEIDAGAALWRDRSDGTSGLTWPELQAKYPTSFVNKIWVGLGTGQGTSTTQVDKVTVNDNIYDFVFTGLPPLNLLFPDYKNALTVQEVENGTATWEPTICTDGAVTLTTTGNPDQAVVNLPVLPLGLELGALSEVASVAVAVAANTGQNAAINFQVFEDAIAGPYRTVQHQISAGFTGVVEATDQTWLDRSTGSATNYTWSEILGLYGDLPVNRVWLSLGTGQGAATSSVDYVTINDAIYDFVVENPADVPAPALPADVPGTVDGSLVLDPTTVAQGDAVDVSGDGFEPTSPVNLGLYAPQADLGSSTTDVIGDLDASVTIPADAPVGEHTVLAIGGSCQEDYSVGQRVLTAPITVEESDELEIIRYAGSDRYETAALVSAGTFDPGVEAAFIVAGSNFPDGLAAGPAAAEFGGPVLPVRADSISGPVADELDRLDPGKIVVVGGLPLISEQVQEDLAAYTDGPVTRIAGSDRYETASKLATYAYPDGPTGANYTATGLDFPDALGAGAAAGELGGTVMLTRPDALPATTAQALRQTTPEESYIAGGTGVVSEAVEAELDALVATDRLSGTSRDDTAVAISESAFTSADTVFLTSRATFADALSAGAAAAEWGAPLLLSDVDCVSQSTRDEVERLGAGTIVVLGGETIVSDDAAMLTVCTP